MSIKLLDCTLRDGGYLNNWNFSFNDIKYSIERLTKSNIDYIELGYLNSAFDKINGSQFQTIEFASKFIPTNRSNSKYLIMADVAQYTAEDLCERNYNTLDGIRVVFYKRQIEQAYEFCKIAIQKGYDIFLQPMVTVDYSKQEFEQLIKRFDNDFKLSTIAIVDSFGCMKSREMFEFLKILENITKKDTKIGFHGHNNMMFALSNALELFKYETDREIIIDSSICGMGRGAGNLNTELIADFYNIYFSDKYDLSSILEVASRVVEPLSKKYKWGYSLYLYITAYNKCHPNFATYLLGNYDVTVNEFTEFIALIPEDMKTKCTRPYVEELYQKFINCKKE
jgi:4-hydroxy 2-oxovalerate aldolase